MGQGHPHRTVGPSYFDEWFELDVGADAGCFEHHCYVPDWWMWPRSLTEEVGFLGTAMVMESCLERVVWGLQWEQETGILVGVVGG